MSKLFDNANALHLLNNCQIQIINSRDENYLQTYPILLKHIQNTCKKIDEDSLTLISQLVYGWMPTILKSINADKLRNKAICNEALSLDARNINSVIDFVEDKLFKELVNNSWIGLSKVLHFINPNVFPIWDSNVALCFSVKPDNKENYIRYIEFVHDNIDITIPNIDKLTLMSDVSKVRKIEFALFIEGRKLKSHS